MTTPKLIDEHAEKLVSLALQKDIPTYLMDSYKRNKEKMEDEAKRGNIQYKLEELDQDMHDRIVQYLRTDDNINKQIKMGYFLVAKGKMLSGEPYYCLYFNLNK